MEGYSPQRFALKILPLFIDAEVNNCFSIYHNKTKMTKIQETTKNFKTKTIDISARVIVVNKTVFARFSNFIH